MNAACKWHAPAATLANSPVSRKERNPICLVRESLANALDGELVQKMVLAVLVRLCYRASRRPFPIRVTDARCAIS